MFGEYFSSSCVVVMIWRFGQRGEKSSSSGKRKKGEGQGEAVDASSDQDAGSYTMRAWRDLLTCTSLPNRFHAWQSSLLFTFLFVSRLASPGLITTRQTARAELP